MVDRYRNQVGEQAAPNARMANTGGPAAYGVQAAQAVGGLGEDVNRLGAIALRKQDEFDMIRVEQANNEYMKAMMAYTNDPGTGIWNTKKQLGANGVTQVFEQDSQKIAQGIADGLDNPRQKAAFQRAALRSSMPFYKATQEHETREMQVYKDTEFKTTLETNRQMVLANPADQTTMQTAVVNIAAAVEANMVGASDSVKNAAVKEQLSNLEMQRLSIMGDTDPVGAMGEVGSSKYLQADDKQKLQHSLKAKATAYQGIALGDEMFSQYSEPDQVYDGIRHIQSMGLSPEMESAAISRFQNQHQVENIRTSQDAAEIKAFQKQNADGLARLYAQGGAKSDEELEAMEANGDLASGDTTKYIVKNHAMANDGLTEKTLAKRIQGWSTMSQDQKDRAKFDLLGVTQESHMAQIEDLNNRLFSGDLTESDLKDLKNSNAITTREYNDYAAALKSVTGDMKSIASRELTKFKTIMNPNAKGGNPLLPDAGVLPDPAYQNMIARFQDLQKRIVTSDASPEEKAKLLGDLTNEMIYNQLTRLGLRTPEELSADAEAYNEAAGKGWSKKGLDAAATQFEDVMKKLDSGAYDTVGFGGTPKISAPKYRDIWSGTRPLEEILPQTPAYRGGSANPVVTQQVNNTLVNKANETAGIKYQMGAKDLKSGKVDCSGLVCAVYGDSMKAANKNNGQEVFDKSAMNAVSGASADIIQNVAQKTGTLITQPRADQLQEGMIIGLNADPKRAGGNGFKGIDHVAMVVRDPGTGQLMVYESRSGDGVSVEPANKWLFRYRQKGVPTYAVNPLLMAKDTTKPPSTPASQSTQLAAAPQVPQVVPSPQAQRTIAANDEERRQVEEAIAFLKGGTQVDVVNVQPTKTPNNKQTIANDYAALEDNA